MARCDDTTQHLADQLHQLAQQHQPGTPEHTTLTQAAQRIQHLCRALTTYADALRTHNPHAQTTGTAP